MSLIWGASYSTGQASLLYDATLHTSPPAIATAITPSTVSTFDNCFAAEGCFGKPGLVDVAGGNKPTSLTFNFAFTPQQLASFAGASNLQATLTIVAARDIGLRCGTFDAGTNTCTSFLPGTEFLVTTADGTFIDNFFQNTQTTCPAGERGTAYPADLVCGPNFHTDITASDSAPLTASEFLTDAGDGSISVVTGLTADIGRLKIFDVELQVSGNVASVPEPSTLALLGLGLFSLPLARRQRRGR